MVSSLRDTWTVRWLTILLEEDLRLQNSTSNSCSLGGGGNIFVQLLEYMLLCTLFVPVCMGGGCMFVLLLF